LDEVQAAILNDRLPYVDAWNEERRRIATAYAQGLDATTFQVPVSMGADYVAHLFVVRVANRDRFRQYLTTKGIDTEIHYPVPDHLQRAYPMSGPADGLPHTAAACASVVSLPCYPGLSHDQQMLVIAAADEFLSAARG
jgi:dTDP-4-amino-4,6-dideoxygalactose transaminase